MSYLKTISIFLIILFGFLSACTEKFYPEIETELSILVIDGKITNQPGPYEIRLFNTVDLIDADTIKPEQDAIIVIYDDLGNSDTFLESAPGVYLSQDPSFQGQIGRSYWIEIVTSSGTRYESTPEKIQPEVTIESIYGINDHLLFSDGSKIDAAKIQVDAKDPSNTSNYIRWEYIESWEWRNPYFLPKTVNPANICYPKVNSSNVYVFNASNQNKKEFKGLNTSFITVEEVKLNYEYNIEVSLYSINQESFEFWQSIEAASQENGGLYSSVPANAKGNICACETNDPVLGYFEASSVSIKSTSFSKQDFNLDFPDFPPECEIIIMRFRDGRPDESRFHIVDSYTEGVVNIFVVRRNHCYDCNFKYSPNKPSFWP